MTFDLVNPSYLYTGQGFLVRKDSGILNLATLNGQKIGLLKGTTAEQNLIEAMKEYGGTFIPAYYQDSNTMLADYQTGKLDAIINDLPVLSGLLSTLVNPNEHRILDQVISKEPLAMAVDENQSDWKDIVSWVIYALIQAEEYGITSTNIDDIIATTENPNILRFLGKEGNIGEVLGLSNDFAVNIIKAVGNYGEIYNRHFDSNILRRDLNELSSGMGLQYALPFTDTPSNNAPSPVMTNRIF